MVPENARSDIPAPGTTGTATEPQSDTASEQALLDPAALVAQMVAAGEWPEPALMEKIVQAGDAAVKPLIAVLRTYPHGWPAEAPFYHAIGLLGVMRPPRAIRELVEIIKRYGSDSGDEAARAVSRYGAVGFESLLELLHDPGLTGYKQRHAIDAARVAAGNDPALRARLREVLRFFLANAIERSREEIRQWKMRRELEQSSAGSDIDSTGTDASATVPEGSAVPSSDGGPAGVEEDLKLELHEEIALLVNDLANLADPVARNLIKTAFDEDLVDTSLVDAGSVEETYRQGGEPAPPVQNWLGFYRERYQEHTDYLNRPPTPPLIPTGLPVPIHVEPETTAPPPVPAMIRNVGPKLGRNDPCWCGSGKKYKKCHLGKDNFR